MWKLKKRKTQKGDKTMENYEVKGVSQASEIRKAYEEAVKANAPKYRAVSKTSLIYGWDEKANKFIKAEIGQEWFDNPHYIAPVETIEETEDVLDEVVEVAEEMVEEVKAEEVVSEEKEPEVDYKALYEEKCKELENANTERDIYVDKYQKLSEEFTAYREIVEKFKAL